jgi:hypothetical protein
MAMQYNAKYSVETTSLYYLNINPKGKIIMKSIIKSVFRAVSEFFSAVGLASYAAHQARNGQYRRAQNHYKD